MSAETETRQKVLDTVRKILIGPNPLPYPEYRQSNGEEILYFDSPLQTYVAGILFTQSKIGDGLQDEDNGNLSADDATPDKMEMLHIATPTGESSIAESTIEADTSKINNFRQSAMGMTLCIPNNMSTLVLNISVGAYFEQMAFQPKETKDEEGKRIIVNSEKQAKCYYRKQVKSTLVLSQDELPSSSARYKTYVLSEPDGTPINGLEIAITFRLTDLSAGYSIYTFTLLNTKKSGLNTGRPNPLDCWYQCEFSVFCKDFFIPLPSNYSSNIEDDDYQLNSLLYRNVKTYAIGHGCAPTWDDSGIPQMVIASIMPEYEVKPIVPTTSSAELSMKLYATEREKTFFDLEKLCSEYESWIMGTETGIANLSNEAHIETAKKQIELCKMCLSRMRTGIQLLKEDDDIFSAFQLANRAMLMQQLHYKLPLREFEQKTPGTIALKDIIPLPDFNDESTWYNKSQNIYGKWRPFQIAFILLNILSISDKDSTERGIVDLIWFPTGGGKTEAYLGLTAFTILLRRIRNRDDYGTTVIMRYTLRLLTAQQFERAASLICSLEKLRSGNEQLLGTKRITIGLWVGESLTENNTKDVITKIRGICAGKSNDNVSVVLKCPWCGASMETFKLRNASKTPGYAISPDKKKVLFKCGNPTCDFSKDSFSLPLSLFDDDIYSNPPSLLFGTVDKFAMLPFKPEAKSIFGGNKERTPPELIIQDELHLITGPLGSAVGLYETIIEELCKANGCRPKIIASTATISHAKQQCNALYGCGEDKVFQFPVPGITYNDCFFAKEDIQATGRRYVGLYGAAASSSATASIHTFAAFLYAAMEAESDVNKRDPYWTNLAYFGSMRELGQAATWYITDIKEYLEVIYRNRLESSLGSDKRRYLYENGLAELTSRMSNDRIPKILKQLEVKYGEVDKHPLDICLATNMISVGVDISRLGLMTVTGQPKSMSEYIQATSRVGRDGRHAPGIVFVIYNTSKPRDKSHYEKFQAQHAKLYYSVEPTSVTPFSRPLRERALHALLVAFHRFNAANPDNQNAQIVPTEDEFKQIEELIVTRANGIDPEEVTDMKKQLETLWKEWVAWKPSKYYSYNIEEEAPLLHQAGTELPMEWGKRGWSTPTSMRNVDRECRLDCSKRLFKEDDDNE